MRAAGNKPFSIHVGSREVEICIGLLSFPCSCHRVPSAARTHSGRIRWAERVNILFRLTYLLGQKLFCDCCAQVIIEDYLKEKSGCSPTEAIGAHCTGLGGVYWVPLECGLLEWTVSDGIWQCLTICSPDIPVFPTITATVTFQEFRCDEFDGSIFAIPEDYKEDPSRFPDL